MSRQVERTEYDSIITSQLLSIQKGDFLAGNVFNNGTNGTKSKIVVKILKIERVVESYSYDAVPIVSTELKLEVIRASIDNLLIRIGDIFYTSVFGHDSILNFGFYVLGEDKDKIPNIMSPFERTVCRFLKVMILADKRIPQSKDDFYIVFKSFLDLVMLLYSKLDDGYSYTSFKNSERALIRKILKYNKKVKFYLSKLNSDIFSKEGFLYEMFSEFLMEQLDDDSNEFTLRMLLAYMITQEAKNLCYVNDLFKEITRLQLELENV